MNDRCILTTLALALTLGLAVPGQAANSKSKMPKEQPGRAAQAKPDVKPPEVKNEGRKDDFRDNDNNGVDDRHEKKAIRPEPTVEPATLKPIPKPEAQSEEKAKLTQPPPAKPPAEPPASAPPR